MNALYQLLRKLVLPSNATSGARIVLDGTTNAILMYSAANNLIESISATAGVDSAGNHYPAGYCQFGDVTTNIPFVNILNGVVYQGILANRSSNVDYTHVMLTAADSPTSAEFNSPWTAGNNAVQFLYTAGTGSTVGTNAPSFQMQTRGAGNFPLDAVILGALRGGDVTNGPATWQTPAYNPNWADSSAFNGQLGQAVLRFRKGNEDNVRIYGCAVASAGAGAVPFVLPVGWRPLGAPNPPNGTVMIPAMQFDPTGGKVISAMARIDGSGNITFSTAQGFAAIVAGTQVWISGEFPIGNLP